MDRTKAYALTARHYKAGNFDRYATKSSDQIVFELFGLSETCIAKFNRYGVKFLTHDTKIAKPLTAGDYGKLGKYGNYLKSMDCETQIRKLTPIECERLQTVLPNSRLVVYPQCGHLPMIEAAGSSTHELLRFLAEERS